MKIFLWVQGTAPPIRGKNTLQVVSESCPSPLLYLGISLPTLACRLSGLDDWEYLQAPFKHNATWSVLLQSWYFLGMNAFLFFTLLGNFTVKPSQQFPLIFYPRNFCPNTSFITCFQETFHTPPSQKSEILADVWQSPKSCSGCCHWSFPPRTEHSRLKKKKKCFPPLSNMVGVWEKARSLHSRKFYFQLNNVPK